MGEFRSELLIQAIEKLKTLSAEEQDTTAIEILAQISSDQEWILVAASEPYQKWQAAQPDVRRGGLASLCERVL